MKDFEALYSSNTMYHAQNYTVMLDIMMRLLLCDQ